MYCYCAERKKEKKTWVWYMWGCLQQNEPVSELYWTELPPKLIRGTIYALSYQYVNKMQIVFLLPRGKTYLTVFVVDLAVQDERNNAVRKKKKTKKIRTAWNYDWFLEIIEECSSRNAHSRSVQDWMLARTNAGQISGVLTS